MKPEPVFILQPSSFILGKRARQSALNALVSRVGMSRRLSRPYAKHQILTTNNYCYNPHMDKRKVLFLCTGNSCRSQMAEAIVNARLGEQWQAVSAGTIPTGYVHPKALAALQEIGITHDGRSKSADEFRDVAFDVVVTVCDSAAEECPVWLGQGRRRHHSFPDPAKTDDMADFRAVRDAIAREMPLLLSGPVSQ